MTIDPMSRALELAWHAWGNTSPNPAVGAVIVSKGQILGEGYTQPFGGPHAEVEALRQAGERARGATLYVTLEPCCHRGKTPPCVQAIISAGVREVQIAALDANARVNGDGRNLLEAAGIATKTGDREEEAREIVEAHFKWINTREPFVSVKYAMSSDGKIATTTGDSRWITGEGARTYTHRLRRACDAIMIGGGTALRDDPQLTARDSVEAVAFQPLRVIVDSHGLLPTDARLLKQPGNVLVAVAGATPERESALRAVGADVLRLPDNEGRVDIRALLKDLGGRQVTSLLVEGGGTLIASLVEAGLVDKIYAFIAPLVIGGAEAPTPVDGHGALRIVEARRLERVRWKEFGEDMLLIGYPSAR